MSVQDQKTDQVINDALRQISHIATLPEITLKIIELVEDQSSTAQDLHTVIQNDPALCSRVLKVVNSSFYGLPGQIGSINRAIVLLGLNAVKNIAISASVNKLFRGGELSQGFSGRALWTHSISTAVTAKLIANELKIGMTDEIFLGGLMHDIGMMVELQYDRETFVEIVGAVKVDSDGAPEVSMLDIEREMIGADHQQFGEGICHKWKFPKSLAQIAGNHHNPLDLPPDERTLAAIVHVADRLVGGMGPGAFRFDLPDLTISHDVLDELKLTSQTVDRLSDGLDERIEEAMTVMY